MNSDALTQEEIAPMQGTTLPIRPRKLRRVLALTAFGAVMAGTGLGYATDAHASPETDFLSDLNSAGVVIYDTQAALSTGNAICSALNSANGAVVAENLYTHTTYSDVPDRATAAAWVVIAVKDLCPWHDHTQSGSYVA